MKTKGRLLICALLALVSGCASLRAGGDVAAGRRALLGGNNETALAYFQSAAEIDPDYKYGSAYKQGILSYVGRTQYALGHLPQARETLQNALAANKDEDIARIYLGLTLARSGDRPAGLKEIESGMRGINDFIEYITQAHRFSFGQFWDPAREIRSAIQTDLAMISTREFDWQKLISDSEWVAKRMEEEGDKARNDEMRDRNRDSEGKDNSK